ncbi:granzyme-like protein 1 [Oryzias melastigma]|uniref:granzyme-like protein 1 n=1 Tax=Oryzias melastigma TaxID=30732 RepID=UPI00168CF05B|nr:granzyme-like protein 1 [Oryzias melastigma]
MQDLGEFLLFLTLICAGSHVHGSAIINGDLAPEDSMQFMVSVQSKKGHVCGGFLIEEDFVVTAAHCNLELTHVILGGHNWKNPSAKKIEIINQCKHHYKETMSGHDIMLLKLAKKAPKGNNIKTIPLAEMNMNLKENQLCSVAGWGKTKNRGHSVDALRMVNVTIIDQTTCKKSWPKLPNNVICAGGFKTKKGFCQGDSGGPLVCSGRAVGIVSFNKEENCKYPDVPNVYTDIRGYVKWIKDITSKKTCLM